MKLLKSKIKLSAIFKTNLGRMTVKVHRQPIPMRPETKRGFVEFTALTLIAMIFVAGIVGGVIGSKTAQNRYENFLGANITTTTLQNTINDFRNNVNNSLININDQLTSSTAINPGHRHTSSSISDWGVFATSSLGNASGTNMDLSGYLVVLGSTTLRSISFNSASGTGNLDLVGYLGANNLRTGNTIRINSGGDSTLGVVSSTNITASGFLQGANLNISSQAVLNGGVSSTGNFTITGNAQITSLVDSGGTKYTTTTQNFSTSTTASTTMPADTVENTAASWTISGGTLSANAMYEVAVRFTVANNANLKRVRFKLAGQVFCFEDLNSVADVWVRAIIYTRNSQSLQFGYCEWGADGTLDTGQVPTAMSYNMANNQTFAITVEKASGADSVVLETLFARIFK